MKIFRKVSIFVFTFLIAALLVSANVLPFGIVRLNGNEQDVTAIIAEAKSTDYYADIDTDLQGTAFRSEVAELITSTHTKLTTYKGSDNYGLKAVFKKSDADMKKSGNIIWFYSGTSVSFSSFGSGTSATNREHVWPKNAGKAFDAESRCGSDAHHLRPANAQLNSTRSNNNFGEVATTNSNIVYENGKTTYPSLCYQANKVFYPGEGYRGATARILMYVQTRWGDENNLKFVLGKGENKTIGDIATLLKWHYEEPPTAEEIARNEYVYSIQGNRNPFIDHPEYATKIYCYDGESYNSKLQSIAAQYDNYTDSDEYTVATELTVTPTETELTEGSTVTLSANVSPTDAKRNFTFTSSNTSVATVSSRGVVTAVKEGTATVTVKENYSGLSKTVTIKVTAKKILATALSVSPASAELNLGDLMTITTVASPSNAVCSFTYSTSNPSVAEVDEYGVVMGCGAGTATITVTEVNSNLTKTVVVTVIDNAATPAAKEFITYVLVVRAKLGQQSAYDYIVKALNAYGKLNDNEKAAVESSYKTLVDCVLTYNEFADTANTEHVLSVDNALSPAKNDTDAQ